MPYLLIKCLADSSISSLGKEVLDPLSIFHLSFLVEVCITFMQNFNFVSTGFSASFGSNIAIYILAYDIADSNSYFPYRVQLVV